jgi:hypothetical protein
VRGGRREVVVGGSDELGDHSSSAHAHLSTAQLGVRAKIESPLSSPPRFQRNQALKPRRVLTLDIDKTLELLA